MAHWKLLVLLALSITALSAFTAAEAPRLNEATNVATWLLGAGWLALAFGLGITFQKVRGQGEWLASVSKRVRALEQAKAPDQANEAALATRVEGLCEGMTEIKQSIAEIRTVMLGRAKAAGVGD